MLNAVDVSLGYDHHDVVSHLSLSLEPGTITTLIGPNGCGKSTILRSLARLHPARTGAILLDGHDIHRQPTREVARRLGFLAQNPQHPDGLSVVDLVRRGRFPHHGPWEPLGAEDEEEVQRALAWCGLADLAHRSVDTLSGGQRQRAWLALTLAQQTPLILLDEPTTFLDQHHQDEVLDLLARLNREQGRTLVLVLHDLHHARRLSHRVVALRQGVVRADGTPEAVLTPQVLEDVFDVAFDARGPIPNVTLAATPALGRGPHLVARRLVVGYGAHAVAGPVDLDLPPGQLVALLGPNGCGKSTLVRTLAGLQAPLGGEVVLNQRPLTSWGRLELARVRAYVRQDSPLPTGFAVHELLALGRFHRTRLWGRLDQRDRGIIHEALGALDLRELEDRPLEQLSGGQRQRVWLALALVQGSPLLILDEPTSFLDPRHQRDLLDALWTLTRRRATTVLAVLHDGEQARRYADHVLSFPLKGGSVCSI